MGIERYLSGENLREQEALWNLFTCKDEYSRVPQGSDFYADNPEYYRLPHVSRKILDDGFCPEYPDGRRFGVCLTHDVDNLYPPPRHMVKAVASSLRRFNGDNMDALFKYIHGGKKSSPYLNFKKITALEEEYGGKSTFFFLATDLDPRGFRYDIEDVKDELGYLLDSGNEIGLHGGFFSYDDGNEIHREKIRIERILGKNITGFRNHYLRFRFPATWEHLESHGFQYDSTVGFNHEIGFRNGMCHPFHPFNLTRGSFMDIYEIPLVLMDSALFESSGSYEQAFSRFQDITDTVLQCHGILTIDWHSERFSSFFDRYACIFYKKMLRYLVQKGAWITNGADLVSWWKKNA
jgi:peptidoglycan/xylan/chitin deacetylase (PgdA/CDA1 family)